MPSLTTILPPLSLLLLTTPTSAHHPWFPSPISNDGFNWPQTKSVIAFGDSYTYVQGTPHGRQNYSFIGDLQNLAFTPEELLGSRIVQNFTATAEGGPNWIEYLTCCGLQPGSTNPQDCETKQLWDFAFAGADISITPSTPLHHNFTVPLVDQIDQFLHYANPVLEEQPIHISKSETLIAIWIGINDIGDSATESLDFRSFYANITTTLFESVQKIYDVGYRKFLFMQLPPLDRTPSNLVRKAGPRPNATMVEWYNDALAERAWEFAERNAEEARVLVFPTTEVLNWVLDHAGMYGISNTTGYCAAYDQSGVVEDPAAYGCLELGEYFWFNKGHMTSHTHRILAGEVEKFLLAQSEWVVGA